MFNPFVLLYRWLLDLVFGKLELWDYTSTTSSEDKQ